MSPVLISLDCIVLSSTGNNRIFISWLSVSGHDLLGGVAIQRSGPFDRGVAMVIAALLTYRTQPRSPSVHVPELLSPKVES
jgi:hypothetical protein